MRGSSLDQLRDLDACAKIWQAAAERERSLDDAAGTVMEIACSRVGDQEIYGMLVLEPAPGHGVTYRWTPWGQLEREPRLVTVERDFLAEVRKNPRTVVVQDVWQREAPTYKRYTTYRVSVNAEIAVPLWRGDEVIGVVDLGSATPGAFWEDDRLWLEQGMSLTHGYRGCG